jgi:oligoendopeptidase F
VLVINEFSNWKGVEQKMQHPLNETWDLDIIFPNGSHSNEFKHFLDQLETDLSELELTLKSFQSMESAESLIKFISIIESVQYISKRLKHGESFTACLAAQNQQDRKALLLAGKINSLNAAFTVAMTLFDQCLIKTSSERWNELLSKPEIQPIAFILNERRAWALEKMAPEQEGLLADLSVDGYHGWGDFYNSLVSQISIETEEDGQQKVLSTGQAENKLHHPDRGFREKLFIQWEGAWQQKEDLFADTINRLSGFRLQSYKHRGWDSILKEPLHLNRCSNETLDVMWNVIEKNKPIFTAYLERKASLMGLDKLAWHDVEAPIKTTSKVYSYDEAAELIVDQFRTFSPKLAEFTEMAFEQQWIETEDRSDKRPGGFCTGFPVKEQTRIFMTYAGSASNVATLAHEIGHAYHQSVMEDLPDFNQDYAMNVAETASTFAEMIVADATVKVASTADERIALLEDKIQRSIAFYMNIHARFLFEIEMYKERKNGLLDAAKLNQLMLNAQKQAYADSLSSYHPRFWASKLHFYLTDVPFYNFPYTFGYMFSAGLYARAIEQGDSFEDDYVQLLRDTGRMTVEELAEKHLGSDLTKEDFWQQAMNLTVKDVQTFLELTK